MDFVSRSFPETKVHIALYKLASESQQQQTVVAFPDKKAERRTALAQLAKTYQA